MKKLLSILIVIVLAAVSPYIVGSKAETHIKKILELSKQNPSYSIEIVEYNKGWFSTTASFDLTIAMPIDPKSKKIPKIRIIEEMKHGPLLWNTEGIGFGLIDSSSTIQLPTEWQAELDSNTEGSVQINSRTAFNGSTKTYFSMQAISIKDDMATVNIHPAMITVLYTMDGQIKGQIDWDGMEVSEQGNAIITMGALNANFVQHLVAGEMFAADAMFSGTFDSSIEQIAITQQVNQQTVDLNNITMTSTSDVHEDMMDADMVFNIAKISAMGQQLNDFNFDMSMKNFDIQALQDLNRMMVQSQAQLQQNPEAFQEQFINSLIQEVLPKLINKGPLITINNFGVTTSEGTIVSEMNLAVNSSLYEVANPGSLFLALEIDSNGSAPEAFLVKQGLAQMIEPMVQQKMLTREAENLNFQFTMRNGQPLINGMPMPMGNM